MLRTQLKAEIQQLKDETSVRLNGSSEETKVHEVNILNLTNELTSVRNELNSVNQKLLEVETEYQKELSAALEHCSAMKVQLEEQKVKNDVSSTFVYVSTLYFSCIIKNMTRNLKVIQPGLKR